MSGPEPERTLQTVIGKLRWMTLFAAALCALMFSRLPLVNAAPFIGETRTFGCVTIFVQQAADMTEQIFKLVSDPLNALADHCPVGMKLSVRLSPLYLPSEYAADRHHRAEFSPANPDNGGKRYGVVGGR